MCKEESITTEVAKGEEESAVGEAAAGEDGGYENGGEGVREERSCLYFFGVRLLLTAPLFPRAPLIISATMQ
ncbi:hypothetical protein L2E82_14270 [Cichorium intybus]|uniref:Uncharacterized protein n=1 Tax=Cichorium intybus TaxID=13427 RepID=A0ACB9F050_CICIN|nr:hypothetical protein L2E82_14270 [Cichorium intybus]